MRKKTAERRPLKMKNKLLVHNMGISTHENRLDELFPRTLAR